MIRILIVDDEEAIANLIRMNLVKAGYQCEVASDGEEAADAIQERAFDLILLDIMLPKLNGYEVLEYAKTMDTPVIFLTAMGETQQKVKGLKLGAEDYIAKPFEIAELLARVETVLRRYKKTESRLHFLDIEIDTDSRTVLQGGRVVDLTTKDLRERLGRRVQRHGPDGRPACAAAEEKAWPGGAHCGDLQGGVPPGKRVV